MREFIDEYHQIEDEYTKIMDKYTGKNANSIVPKLKKLITIDSDFFDTYYSLEDLLRTSGKKDEANDLVNLASKNALKKIVDEKGNWPDRLEWVFIENRHIIRALLNQALLHWKEGNTEPTLVLLRNLLRSDPDDHIGARYYILAIRKNMKFTDFELCFNKNGFYDNEIDEWFNKNLVFFPDEFEWWEKETEEVNTQDGEIDENDFYGESGIRFI
jgi:tetratricopeptide (TPR) repeat protein